MHTPASKPQKAANEYKSTSAAQRKKSGQSELDTSNERVDQSAQLQQIANTYVEKRHPLPQNNNTTDDSINQLKKKLPSQNGGSEGVVQRAVDIFLKYDTDSKKKLVATGLVEDFQGGSSAKDRGWLGVTKYRARYKIEDGTFEDTGESGTLYNDFTNPEAGHVLAKRNGGDGTDDENIFAQDGGSNNGIYKAFEGRMRRDLNKYEDDDDVEFVAYLEGDDIEIGKISDAGLSDASDISSEDDDDAMDEA